MQRHSSPALDAFFIFFTFIIDPLFVTACVILMLLVMRRKLLAYTTVLFILFNSYLTTVLKAFFAAPRPYWTAHAVRNIGYYCPKDFGNPSGHAEFAAVVACVILLDLVDRKRQKVWGVVAVLLMGAVSTSRLYLGGHSLDQVMLGLYMGIALSLLYSHGGLKQLIQRQLLGSRTSSTGLILAGLAAMHLLTLAGYWMNEWKQKSHRQEARVWMANYKEKCGKTIDEQYLNLMMAALSSVVTSTCAGLIFGMRSLSAHPHFQLYASGLWKMNIFRYSAVVRYIFFYAIEGGLFLAGLLLMSPLLLLGQGRTVMVVFANLGSMLGIYLLSAYSFRLQSKCGLVAVGRAEAKES